MRILLAWSDKDRELAALIRALNTNPYTLVYWLGYEGMEAFNQPGVIFHSERDAGRALPAPGVDTSDFDPPGADIISKLRGAEALILTIMNRSSDAMCVDERRHLYYEMLRYWHGVFRKYRPELVIFPVEPHAPHDYLIYELAKLFSVRTFFFNETRVSDRLLGVQDFREGSNALRREIEKNRGRDFALEDLRTDIRAYYERRTSAERDKAPPHVDFLQNKYSLARRFSFPKLLTSVRDGTFFKKTWWILFGPENAELIGRALAVIMYAFRPSLKKEYRRFATQPDIRKQFVYVPLQVQPERSTSPVGDMFADQILMIETLSAALPQDWVLYVKEHPIQWVRYGVRYSSSRYRGYYEKVARIPHVALVPVEASSYALTDAAKAVATITGAPGWEAIVRGKPSLIFGYPWYKDSPGAFTVQDAESCRRALHLIADGTKPERQAVINFLKSLDDATTHGYIAESNKKSSTLDRHENMQGICDIILRELDATGLRHVTA